MKLIGERYKTEIMKIINVSYLKIIVFIFFFGSCNNIPFESEKWLLTDSVEYLYRNAMVNDLIKNYLYKGKNFDDISPLLGGNVKLNGIDNTNPFTKYYELQMLGADRGTYLYVKLNSNGYVEEAKLIDYPEILRKKH